MKVLTPLWLLLIGDAASDPMSKEENMDLQKLHGDRQVISLDESWMAETRENRREFLSMGDQWKYFEILGRYGKVYPYSEEIAAVFVTALKAKRLIAFLTQHGVQMARCDE